MTLTRCIPLCAILFATPASALECSEFQDMLSKASDNWTASRTEEIPKWDMADQLRQWNATSVEDYDSCVVQEYKTNFLYFCRAILPSPAETSAAYEAISKDLAACLKGGEWKSMGETQTSTSYYQGNVILGVFANPMMTELTLRVSNKK